MSEEPHGLRERRRRETTSEIQRVTIDLLETRGWEATTVADIAHTAGISPRTFFRYFDSKEQAALPGQRRLWLAVNSFSTEEHTLEAVTLEVERVLRAAMLGSTDSAEIEVHRRVARLFQTVPHLYAVASAQDAEFVRALRERCIALLPDTDVTLLHGLAESAMAIWRTAWWHWGTQLSSTPSALPTDSFSAAIVAVRGAVTSVTPS